MPSATIPFFGSFTRPVASPFSTTDGGPIYKKGQKFVNCIFTRNVNDATQSQTVAVEKRPGLTKLTSWGSSTEDFTALIAPAFNNSSYFGAYGSTNSAIVGSVGVTNTFATSGSRSIGTVTGEVRAIAEAIYDSVGHIAMVTSDGTGWYYAANAGTGSPTFTADTSSGSATLSNVSSFTGLYVGQALSGTGIPATARIQSMNSGAGTLEMGSDSATATNATANGTGVTITRTPIAKIIDVDFPSAVGALVFVDGYAFVMTAAGRVYNSALNSISSWGASDYITANLSTDQGISLARYKNQILAFGSDSCEPFYNAGNASGSVLGRSDQSFFKIGAFGANSIVNVEDTIYWLGVSSSSGAAIYRLDGFTPRKVSTQEVDSVLNTLVGSITVGPYMYLGAASVFGDINLFLTRIDRYIETGLTSSIQSFVYNIPLNVWHGWGTGTGVGTINGSFHLPAYVSYYNRIMFGGRGDGDVYAMFLGEICYYRDNTTTGSDGAAYNMIVSTKKLNFGTNNRKFVNRVWLDCDMYDSGDVDLFYLDDDSENISAVGNNPLGSFDITQPNPRIHRCGSFTGGRIWAFIHSEAENFRMRSFTVDYEVGAH